MDKQMFLGASHIIFGTAKKLRDNQTRSELILWQYLKQKPKGYKFRRQHPIGIYILDFYCHALKLVIEADGGIHTDEQVRQHDIERQQNLEVHGLKFLRFTNSEIENNIESVISVIKKYIDNHSLNI